MASERQDLRTPTWDGEPSTFPDYVRKVRLAYERTRARRRKYLGPELVAGLTGRAWTITQEISHRDLVSNDGALFLIRYLEEHLGRVPVPDAGTKAEQLFVRLRRPLNMSMATWCSTVREHYRGLQRALKRARREQDDNRTGSERMAPAGTSVSRRSPPRTPTPTPPPSRDGRARGADGASGPPSPSSSTRRRASKRSVPEPDPPSSAPDEGEFEEVEPYVPVTPEVPSATSPEPHRPEGSCSRDETPPCRRRERDSRSDSNTEDEEVTRGFERCEELDSGLPEVLPTELVGWLVHSNA